MRGFSLFRGKAMCTSCHSGPLFSDFQFHNVSTSLPGADGTRKDEGRFKVTGLEKVPCTKTTVGVVAHAPCPVLVVRQQDSAGVVIVPPP